MESDFRNKTSRVITSAVILLCVAVPGCKGSKGPTEGGNTAPVAAIDKAAKSDEAAKVEVPGATEKSQPGTPEASSASACLKSGTAESCMEAFGETKDQKATLHEASKACDQSNPNGCFLAALMTKNGAGTDRDPEGAASFFQKACDLGHLDSCVDLALEIDKEDAAPEVKKRAMSLLATACKGGNGAGCELAGNRLLLLEDPEAKRLGLQVLGKACELGEKSACEAVEREAKWAADDTRFAAVERKAGAQASDPPQVLKAEGIEWTVKGELASKLKLKGVKCDEPFREKMMCNLTMEFPDGWSISDGMAQATAYDADGVQTERMHVNPNNADVGGTVRERLRVEVSTKRVVIGQ